MPERYLMDRRIVRLSDEAFRAFVTAMMWSVANRTEGVIEDADIALIPGFRSMIASELVAAGLWDLHERGYLIIDFAHTQTTKAQLEAAEHKRLVDRQRQARHRSRKAGLVTDDVTRDVTDDDKGQDRLGQDRLGQADNATTSISGLVSAEEPHNEMQRKALASWNLLPDSKGVA